MKAAVIGSGAWGTALAICLCKNGHDTVLWSHDPQKVNNMQTSRTNPMLEGIRLPDCLTLSADPDCVSDRDLVVFASPSVYIRSVSRMFGPYLREDAVIVSATKGIEAGTLVRMSQIVQEETGHIVVALTGPSHAEELAREMPTGCLAACVDAACAEVVQKAFTCDSFRIYVSQDIVGAELGGALKNVIALCAGVMEGMGHGDNTRALLMTRGLAEIARLGVSMGGKAETFLGLTGMGDLIVTCTSMHSRNRRAGILIGQGKSAQQAMAEIGAVVEGYYAARSAWELACLHKVEMPLTEAAYRVLYEEVSPAEAVRNLLDRRPCTEKDGH